MWLIYGVILSICGKVAFILAFKTSNKNLFSKLPCPSSVTRTSVYKQLYETADSLTAGVLKDSRRSAHYASLWKKEIYSYALLHFYAECHKEMYNT